jgi:hypothetical protein
VPLFPELHGSSSSWEWKRDVYLKPDEHMLMLCCPEDVQPCGNDHREGEICPQCRVPLCANCVNHLLQSESPAYKIPMALTNDNFWGYTCDIIAMYKVRWIEMAAVLPLFTTMMVFYVEGHEGHTMNAVVGQQEWRTSVKGQCFSFVMPWSQIIREFDKRMQNQTDLADLPRNGDTLKYMFRLQLRVAATWLDKDLKQIHLRPFVLIRLLCFIMMRHPNLLRSIHVGDNLQRVVEEMVHRTYPEHEAEKPEKERSGQIPEAIKEILEEEVQEEEEKSRKCRKILIKEKTGIPSQAVSESVDAAMADVEPRCCILDADPHACNTQRELRTAAFEQFSDKGLEEDQLQLTTSNRFEDQWRGDYVSKALALSIPREISGPDFLPRKSRRHPEGDATASGEAEVTMTDFLRGFARRVENPCHSDFTAIPILRSLWYKHTAYGGQLAAQSFQFRRAAPQGQRVEKKNVKQRK